MRKTPWFDPSQRPVRDGRYEAQDKTMHCNCCWIELEWRRGEWFSDLGTPGRFRTHFFDSGLRRWRGRSASSSQREQEGGRG